MDKINCIVPSWQEMHNFAKKTSDNIKQSDFHPDMIIGLSRGGLVPARLFCDFLHIKNCLAIKVDHWGLTATKDGKAELTHKLDLDLSGKKVLIVDDITDTGQSMELAKEHITTLNPADVKTATLIHLNNSKYTPDFYGHNQDWAWIIFPWNYREDLVNLIQKVTKSEEKVVNDIKNDLKLNFKLDVDENEIEEILEHIKYLGEVQK